MFDKHNINFVCGWIVLVFYRQIFYIPIFLFMLIGYNICHVYLIMELDLDLSSLPANDSRIFRALINSYFVSVHILQFIYDVNFS